MEQRIEDLEVTSLALIAFCSDLIEKCVALQKQVDQLSCTYLRHYYSTYHLVEGKNGRIKATKPELPLEDDLLLELTRRKLGKSNIMDYYRSPAHGDDTLSQ